MNLTVSKSIYEGLKLEELFHLATFKTISKEKSKGLWEEIFRRYFNEGRGFNLYKQLTETDMVFFAYAMEHELKTDEVQIPEEHMEAFTKLFVAMVDMIEKKNAEDSGYKFEFAFSNVKALKSFFDKLSTKTLSKDNNVLKQKINLFIDRLEKQEQENLAVVKVENAITAGDFQKKKITVTKNTRNAEFFAVIDNIYLYYPEQQLDIFKIAVTHSSYRIAGKVKNHPFLRLLATMSLSDEFDSSISHIWKDCKTALLQYIAENKADRPMIDAYLRKYALGMDLQQFVEHFKKFFMQAENATEEYWTLYLSDLIKGIDSEMYDSITESIFSKCTEAMAQYKGKTLSEMTNIQVNTGIYGLESTFNVRRATGQPWVFDTVVAHHENHNVKGEYVSENNISALEYVMYLYNRIETMNAEKYGNMIEQYEAFIETIIFDAPAMDIIISRTKGWGIETDYPKYSKALKDFCGVKFEKRTLTDDEIKLLYIDKKGFYAMDMTYCSHYGNGEDTGLPKYMIRALEMFDFTDSEQLTHFFSNDSFNEMKCYEARRYRRDGEKLYPAFEKRFIDLLLEKLQATVPHEYKLITEFFEELEEKEYEISDINWVKYVATVNKAEAVKLYTIQYFKKKFQIKGFYNDLSKDRKLNITI